jgi:ribose 5-phosphate isomerase B
MRVHLGSDHAGLELKEHLLNWLADEGYEVVDHGPFLYDAEDDYPVFCLRCADAVAADQQDGQQAVGVVIGGSGNGEQIAANKVMGIRAALAWSEETAELARLHNDANVLSVGGRMHTIEDMTRFVKVFLTTDYSGEPRHTRRIEMLTDYEKTGNLPPLPESAVGQVTRSQHGSGHGAGHGSGHGSGHGGPSQGDA